MKRFLFAALLLVLSVGSHAQNELYTKYENMRGVQTVYITKVMLDNSNGLFVDDLVVAKMADRLNSIQTISTTIPQVKESMRKDFQLMIKSGKYELLMKQKKLTSSSEVYMLKKEDKIKELIFLKDDAPKLKIVFFEGNMTQHDISQILMVN